MTTREELLARVTEAQQALTEAQQALYQFDTDPQNNVFESVEQASEVLEDRLLNEAHDDCEGSYNVGAEEYRQEFIVEGKRYVAILEVEYNRHDKTYYYVDGSDFRVEEL